MMTYNAMESINIYFVFTFYHGNYRHLSRWEKCKGFFSRKGVSGDLLRRVGEDSVGVVLQVVAPDHGQAEQDTEDDDDEYQEDCAAVVVTCFTV